MAATKASTSSVSKGCFVIRPQKASNARKRKSEGRLELNKGFPCVPGESDEHCCTRHTIYKDTWRKVEEQVSSLQTNLNDEVFGNLLEFINTSIASDQVSYYFVLPSYGPGDLWGGEGLK